MNVTFHTGIKVTLLVCLVGSQQPEVDKTNNRPEIAQEQGIYFSFKGQRYALTSSPVRPSAAGRRSSVSRYMQRDSSASRYDLQENYVEIIRQDDPVHPHFGLAFGFDFDEDTQSWPYTPVSAVLQWKDFTWGGIEFGATDTLNYTGVNNEVSNDLTVEIDSFVNNTISGRFSGLLINGRGDMDRLDSGYFCVRLYRR